MVLEPKLATMVRKSDSENYNKNSTLTLFSTTDRADLRDYLACARDLYPQNPQHLWFVFFRIPKTQN